VLAWPGYRVYQHEINEAAKTLKLWVRRKRGNRKLICSGCGRKLAEAYDSYEREVRDLPCFEFRTTVVVEVYRVRCPDCGVKSEKVPLLPSKAPFSKRFEEAVGMACESASVRRVARQFGRVRCGRLICAICGAGQKGDADRRYGRWGWMRSIWERSRSF